MNKEKQDNKNNNGAAKTEEAVSMSDVEQNVNATAPFIIHTQYIRDASFENPHALAALRPGQSMPEMSINIGMDVRQVTNTDFKHFYEVLLNIKAEAKRKEDTVFIAELQYGMAVSVGENIPEDNHHPLLLIEVPRIAFPFARQILSSMTMQGGFPPLLLNPVDFHALYMQRFAKEIEESKKETKN